jgi:hypothetical protein
MAWVVPIARATFDRCGVVLGKNATLPEAPGRDAYRALGLVTCQSRSEGGTRTPTGFPTTPSRN